LPKATTAAAVKYGFCFIEECLTTAYRLLRMPAVERHRHYLMEDFIMEITRSSRTHTANLKAVRYDTTAVLGCVALSIAFVILIYLASKWPGTAAGDFALMTVFP
jgi:hypothetical protein